ncbi:hypothetical protein QYE76_029076 [Lolium multiflorum]|uniref:Uncharacterized protein n=1 Tax=Lolium multiflorum TaxID=4521 RepID=A0AAD8VHX7_LOLMU|nr:hypothetical protein QYE76_029076 [Lolium multiflorum]
MPSYNCWTKHGERGVIMEEDEEGDDIIDDNYPDHFGDTLMEDGEGEGEEEARDEPVDDLGRTIADARRGCETEKERKNLDRMLEDHKNSLYPGCDNGLKKLGCTLDLLKWKAQEGLSDLGLENLLKMMKNMFPKNNELPASTSHNGEEEESYCRRQLHDWWRRRQIFLHSSKEEFFRRFSSSSGAARLNSQARRSSITKRDEKRARSLGLVSPDEGNVILPGPKDETRINVAELSKKELLDEVRRLTLFSQEDSIPLISSYTPLDADHPLLEIPIVSGDLRDSPNDTSEGRGSSIPVDFHTVGPTSPESEHNDPINSEAAHTDLPSSADDACDTEGSMRDDDADRDTFVNAAVEETRASPVKRLTDGFADEDDLFDIDEGFVDPPAKKAKFGAAPPDVAASEASVPKAAPATQVSTASSLSKEKDAPSTAAARTTPSDLRGVISSLEAFASQFTSLEVEKVRLQKEVRSSSSKLDGAVKIAAEACQDVDSLKEELGKLKEKLREEEATRLAAEARAAKKDELLQAANISADALDKIPNNSPANGLSMTLASHQLMWELLEKGKGAMVFPVPASVEVSSGALSEDDRIQRMKDRITQLEKDLRSTYALAAIIRKKGEIAADVERYALTELHKATESLNFISLNRAEENKRVHERVHALPQLSSAEEIFWREQSKASAVAQFQDRVQQVHHFFDKCYKALRVVWRTMFPLNRVPPTLLTLMSEFGNTKKIRDLVRAQVFAGARFTLALVLARYPSASLLSIANATGDLETLYPKVLLPANMIVDKLEKDSKC